MRLVTVAWLRRHEACETDIAKFQKEWGGKAYITRENLRRARRLGMDVGWLAIELFTDAQWDKFYRRVHGTESDAFWTRCENDALLAKVKR